MRIVLKTGAELEEKTASLLYQVVEEAEADPATKYIWFAPEQMSMDIEKRLIAVHPRHALVNVRVYGLHRFARQQIFAKAAQQPVVIDEVDKILLLEEVVQRKHRELGLFQQKLMNNVAYVGEIKSLISEFQQYCVRPQDLERIVECEDTPVMLREKLADLAILYSGFLESLGSRRLTGESLLERAAAYVTQELIDTEDLSDTVMIFDGFTGFTPQQYSLIEALLPHIKEAIFSIPEPSGADRIYDERKDLFVMGAQMRRRLGETADHLLLTMTESPYVADEREDRFGRDKSAAIAHLRSHLFGRLRPFRDGQQAHSIRIRVSERPDQEVNDVLLSIRRDVRSAGLRYRDIGIIATDPGIYHSILKEMKEHYQVPIFLDDSRPLLRNPLISAALACLEMISENYRYEAVLRFLESGFADIGDQEAQSLERYMLRVGLRGRARWERLIEGQETAETEVAKRLLQPIFDFHRRMVPSDGPTATIADRCQAVRLLLQDLRADDKLLTAAEEVTRLGYPDRAAEYRQSGEKLSLILDKLEQMLGNVRKSMADFIKLLLAAVAEIQLGLVPPTLDAVAVGDLRRSRFAELKKLYILGCHDEAFDGGFSGSSLLNMIEREYLAAEQEKGNISLSLAPTEKEELAASRYYTYMALTRPQSELVLSYSRFSTADKAQQAAPVLQQIKKMFINCEEQAAPLTDRRNEAHTYLPTQLQLAGGLAADLYQNLDRLSPTSLELYAKCPYQFFQKYGLHLAPEQEFEINALDIGSLLHLGLEKVVAWIWGQEQPQAVTREAVIEAVDEVLEQTIREGSVFVETSRNIFLKERLRTMLIDNLEYVRFQIDAGAFSPTAFEKEWRLHWGNEERPLELIGKIDRVDSCETPAGTYARVIDYKSGSTTFSPTELILGTQIQLPLYLAALVQQDNLRPAGMYYYQVKDPIKAAEDVNDMESLFRLSGPTNEQMVEATDRSFSEVEAENVENKAYKSKVVAIERTAKGALHQNSTLLSEEEFDRLFINLREQIEERHQQIHEGIISAVPTTELACQYCNYAAICRISDRVVMTDNEAGQTEGTEMANGAVQNEALQETQQTAQRSTAFKELKKWLANEDQGGDADAVDE